MTTDPAGFPLAAALNELPEHRRDLLLFRHVSRPNFPDIWDEVRPSRCRLPPLDPALSDWARLGSDGRWQWVRDGAMVCASFVGQPIDKHEYDHLYATDGTRYLRQQPESDRGKPPRSKPGAATP